MKVRRSDRLFELDTDNARLSMRPTRAAPLAMAGALLGCAGIAAFIASTVHLRHPEAVWALGGVWAFVALLFAGLALRRAHRLVVDFDAGMVELDDEPYALAQSSFIYDLEERQVGRRRVTVCVLRLSVPDVGTVKLLEADRDFCHNLVAGVQQAQRGDRAGALSTLEDTMLAARSPAARELLLVILMVAAPTLVFWLKGAF
jgi:hypothetical protein